jgi:membrane protein implicated in regulation of membrane protease activity
MLLERKFDGILWFCALCSEFDVINMMLDDKHRTKKEKSMSPLMIYGVITVVCGIILFLMAILGHDIDLDADIDIDIDADVDIDGADTPDTGGPGIFSLKLIMVFLIGFGICGFISTSLKWSVPSIVVALIGGFTIWFICYNALSWLYNQQSTSQVSSASFTGKEAKVTVPIPKGGTGEIYSKIKGTEKSIYLNARSIDADKEFKKGDIVTIESVEGNTATIK